MSDTIEALKARGFRFAIVVNTNETILVKGAHLAYFRVWCKAEEAYLAAVNATYSAVQENSHIMVAL